jgi:ankyrin repeat domain-containing protein 50
MWRASNNSWLASFDSISFKSTIWYTASSPRPLPFTMADPLSIAAGVIAVVTISEQIIGWCWDYIHAAKSAQSDVLNIMNSIAGLKSILDRVAALVKKRKPTSAGTQSSLLVLLTAPNGPLQSCEEALTRIKRKLDTKSGTSTAAQTFRWKWTSKDIEKILQTIEREKTVLILALQAETNEGSLQIQAGVKEVSDSIHEMEMDRRFQNVVNWLSNIDPSPNHDRARKKHQPGTGSWFLHSDTFQRWTTQSGSLVLLHGISGAGKTILCSTILEYVKIICKGKADDYAYFYFDFNDAQRRVPGNMLRSVMAQFCIQKKAVTPELTEMSRSYGEDSVENLLRVLPSILKPRKRHYIVLDALDECERKDELCKILETFCLIPDVNLLVTSRKEWGISDALKAAIKLKVDLKSEFVKADVKVHVQRCLETDKKLKKWPASVKEEISEALVQGANGMLISM